jgi:hypothetical protein
MQRQCFLRSNLWVSRSLALLLTLIIGLGLARPALATPIWHTPTVDNSAGDVGQYNSLALDSKGNPVISYYDNSNFDLKLLRCGNPTCTSDNTIQTVDALASPGQYTSLALDSNDNPVISYYDPMNPGLKLAKCGNPTCSSGNSIKFVERSGLNLGQYTSLVLDSSGNPVISYYDVTNSALKLAKCGNATCSSGTIIQYVDNGADVGQYTSLVLDGSGNPVISYYDVTNKDLKLAKCGNPSCTSGNTIQIVDNLDGMYTSLALDTSGNPVISYYDLMNRDLRLAKCGNATCSSGNVIQTVDSVGSVGEYNSLMLDSSNNPVISYSGNPAGTTNGRALKLVHCGKPDCSSGNTFQFVDNTPGVGVFTSLVLAVNGKPVISYYDVNNRDLKLARVVGDTTQNVAAWGSNTAGESSVPAGLQAVAVTGGRWHSLALKHDGTVVAWGCANGYDYGLCTVSAGLSNVTAIAAAPYHNLALKSDGTVVAWGCGTADYGQCAVPVGLSGVKAVAAGIFHSVALKNDGTVVTWGCGSSASKTPCTVPAGLSGVTAIASGLNHTLALKNNGTVVGWGSTGYGESNGATAGSGVIAIAAAGNRSMALKSNGTVVAWGDNTAGQNNIPAGLTGVVAIAAGGYHSLALKNDGTVVAWGCGTYNNGQCTVPAGLSGVAAIGAGHVHSLALAAIVPAGGVAASAAVSTDAVQSATPTLEGFTFLTESVPVSAPATVDTPVPSQRLFLPLVANNSMMAADNSAAGAPISEAATQSAAVTATVATTLTLTGADPNAGVPSEPVTTTATAPVITTSAPVSVPMLVETAPIVTESVSASAPVSAPVVVESVPVITEIVPVSIPVVVEAAPVITESVPVSVPTAVEAAPAVTETLLLTTTQAITTDAAAATANPLAGTALGNQSGLVVLALVGLAVAGSLLWQRRRAGR